MSRIVLSLTCLLPLLLNLLSVPPVHAKEFYEVRTYVLGDQGDEGALDQYLQDALIPALNRQGIAQVGSFTPTTNDQTGLQGVVVVIPYQTLAQIEQVREALGSDQTYQEAAQAYLARTNKNPPYQRIRSELLVAMDCWPQLKVNQDTLNNDQRVYELRLYESANERLGNLKVDMFNNGEVPIFLDCKISPIFIGQALLGPQTPSLTYLTVYDNEAARGNAWEAFKVHPDWQVLKKVDKYAGTVSRIDKFVLQAKPYSQM